MRNSLVVSKQQTFDDSIGQIGRLGIVRAGFVQINSRLLDVEGNIDKALRLIGNKKTDLIVIPELFNTGYNFRPWREVEKVAEPVPTGATTAALKDLLKRDGATVVAGMAERKGRSLYNSAVILKDGRYLGTYRKVHLFYNEKKFFKGEMSSRYLGDWA